MCCLVHAGCEVQHYLNREESMRCPFSDDGKVRIGVRQSERGEKALSGVILRVYGRDMVELLSAEVPFQDSRILKCRTEESQDTIYMTETAPFEWDNMELITENGTLIIAQLRDKGNKVSVCPKTEVDKPPAFLTITLNLFESGTAYGLHMLCNCFDGE